jgi:uncharacterized protein
MPMILTVHVKPNARQQSVDWIDEDTLKIAVTAVPEKGKANKVVIEALAKELGVAKSMIKLIRGGTTRMKQFRIHKTQH